MSPEYMMNGSFSRKSDVFSFGVLILEIVSGKRNRGSSNTDSQLNLLAQVSNISDILRTSKTIPHKLRVNSIWVLVSLNYCICNETNIF